MDEPVNEPNAAEAPRLEKRCRICLETKSATEFYRNKLRADRLYNECRTCVQRWRAQHFGRPWPPVPDHAPPVNAALKRCCRCREVKSRDDFHRSRGRADGLYSACKTCAQAADRRRHKTERFRASRRRHYQDHAPQINAQRRKYRQEHHAEVRERERRQEAGYAPRARELARQRRQRNPEAVNARKRKYYQRNAARLRQQSQQWRDQNRQLVRLWAARHRQKYRTQIAERMRRRYWANREVLLHRKRVAYWADPQQTRRKAGLYRQKQALRLTAEGRSRAGGKYRRTVSLNETFAETETLSRLDRTADTRVVSPETAAVEAPSLEAVREFVRRQVTDQEREIPEAFADSFSVEGTAELLSITPAEVEATLTAIRSRAAALGSSVDGQES